MTGSDSDPDLSSRLAALSPERRALLDRLRRGDAAGPISPRGNRQGAAVASAQRRMWFLNEYEPDSPAYVMYEAVRISGPLDAVVLDGALRSLAGRHDALHSAFTLDEGELVQRPAAEPAVLRTVDRSAAADADEQAVRLAVEEARRPFDLSRGPLWRVTLVTLAPDQHVLVLTMHHIISDGWSMGVLLRELIALYDAPASGRPDALPAPGLQYFDYAEWQRRRLAGPEAQRSLAYWRDRLHGAPEVLELPTDGARPRRLSGQGDTAHFDLGPDVLSLAEALARSQQASTFAVLLAAFQVLLGRWAQVRETCVAIPVAGRSQPETENVIGLFVNTVVLRVDLGGEPSFVQAVQRVRDRTWEALEHSEVPFDRVVEEVSPRRDTSRGPLAQVMFALQDVPLPELRTEQLTIERLPLHNGTAKFDISLFLAPQDGGGLHGWLEYSTDLFERATAERFVQQYALLLGPLLAAPDAPVSRAALLDPEAAELVLRTWNATGVDRQHEGFVADLFEAQSRRSPDLPAVIHAGATLTYAELEHRTERVAASLRHHGAGPGTVVGICLERSADLVTAVMGVLRAGAAYLPIDPAHPAIRRAEMVADAGAVVVIDDLSRWELPVDGARPALDPPAEHRGGDLAYVIYTSGSTGRPKGVMSTHEGLLNRLRWMQETFPIGTSDRVLHKTPTTFDVSVWELLWPLVTGACVVVAEPGEHRDPERLVGTIRSAGVTTLHFVPSMLGPFLDHVGSDGCPSLRQMICSGEALSRSLAKRCTDLLPHVRLANLYGPTEASIDVSWHEFEPGQALRGLTVPIGRPIANTRLRVLDEHMQLVPVGVPGELHLGGISLARGYLGRPGLTAERFVPDPWADRPGDRLYKTGDRVRYLPDGSIEYLERVDRQVKIGGQRIEPGEVEAALTEEPSVGAAAVVPHEGRLVAYVEPASAVVLDVVTLREQLGRVLPSHLVPATITVLDRLPLTTSGKLDRAALPAPDDSRPDVGDYVPPADDTEELLAALWERVLGVDRVGVEDNVFSLGADSIRCLEVLSLGRARGLELTLPMLFEQQTVRAVARAVADPAAARATPAPDPGPLGLVPAADRERLPEDVGDAYPLSSLQTGMVFDSEASGDYSLYHDVFTFRLRGRFDHDALTRAVNETVQRHDVLRTSIDLDSYSIPLQLVHRTAELTVPVTDLRQLAAADAETRIRAWVEAEYRAPFSWREAPLMRWQVHLTALDSFTVTMSCSDVVLDGWSVASMLTETMVRYVNLRDGGAAGASAGPPSLFRRFVQLEAAALDDGEDRRYWAQVLSRIPPEGDPGTGGLAHRTGRERRFIQIDLPRETDLGLRRLARLAGVPLKSVVLAVHLYVTALGAGPACTGLVTNGRPEEPGSDRVLGLFLNVVPVLADLDSGSWVDRARRAFDLEREHLAHRRYPSNRLRHEDGSLLRLGSALNFVRFHVYEHLAALTALDIEEAILFDDQNLPLWVEFSLDPTSDTASLSLTYDRTVIGKESAELLRTRYAAALTDAATSPDDVPPRVPAREHDLVVRALNETARDHGSAWTLVGAWEEQVARTPTATVFELDDARLTCAEVDSAADRLAGRLRDAGVAPGTVVGVHLHRSLDVPVALWGVLKAGGAYLPLEAGLPGSRLSAMLGEAGPAVVVTRTELADGLADALKAAGLSRTTQVLALDDPHVDKPGRAAPPGHRAAPDDLAYLIFTSGSTGRPKAVAVEHRVLLNRMDWMWDELPFAAHERAAVKTDLGFVDSLWELLGPSLRGIPAVIVPEAAVADPERLVEVLGRHRVTRLWLVPTLLRALLDSVTDLRTRVPDLGFWVTSGEPLPTDLLRRFTSTVPGASLYNLYGISEVWDVSWCDPGLDGDDELTVPIGSPIPNVRCYVLDDRMRPLPVGVPGELYVAGAGLARGYWGAPGATADRFVPDPYGSVPGGRLYRTGDLVSVLPDGRLLHVGRADRQLKVRGHRVEPAEVETLLAEHPQVRDAVVLVLRADADRDGVLAAAIRLEEDADAPGTVAELRALARERLPEQLRPSTYHIVDAWPLTTSGKLDRRALPGLLDEAPPVLGRPPSRPTGDPWTEVLSALAADTLGHPIEPHDDFFDAGGDSLWAMRFAARVRTSLQRSVSVADVLAASNLADLGRRLRAGRAHDVGDEIRPVPHVDGDRLPVSSAQRRLWLTHQLDPDDPAYNLFVAVRLTGSLDLPALRTAVEGIVRRHEPLRTTFEFDGSEPLQRVRDDLAVAVREVDLPGASDEALVARVEEEIRTPFDLASGPVVRALLLRLGNEDHVAVLTVHHIAGDAWSMENLVSELATRYRAASLGEADPPGPLPLRYVDYAVWQRSRLDDVAREDHAQFWRTALAGAPAALPLPAPPGGAPVGEVRERLLDDELHRRVRARAAASGATLFMALLAAYAVVLHDLTDADDIVVGTDVAGREDPRLEGLIGFFVNQLPIRVDLSGDPSFDTLLRRCRDASFAAYDHRDLPFDELVEALRPARVPGRAPVFQVKLVLQNVPLGLSELPGLTVTRLPVSRGTAQLDVNLRAAPTDAGLLLSVEYAADRVATATIERVLEQVEEVLRAVAEDPTVLVSGLVPGQSPGARPPAEPASGPRPGPGSVRRESVTIHQVLPADGGPSHD